MLWKKNAIRVRIIGHKETLHTFTFRSKQDIICPCLSCAERMDERERFVSHLSSLTYWRERSLNAELVTTNTRIIRSRDNVWCLASREGYHHTVHVPVQIVIRILLCVLCTTTADQCQWRPEYSYWAELPAVHACNMSRNAHLPGVPVLHQRFQ